MKILLIDAYDSFVHTIDNYLRRLGLETVTLRNDRVDIPLISSHKADILLLGPGPGHPADARYVALIEYFAGRLPIFGVCLGHQAIALAFGGRIARADLLMHGKTSLIRHDEQGCFHQLPNPLIATRYHSLIVTQDSIPDQLIVTARAIDDNAIMGLRHRHHPIESVQFHPESIETPQGLDLLARFVDLNRPRQITASS